MRPHVPLELPFVGRDAEMRLLREALEESVAGSGRVVLLTGEPGIGKTRTAYELAALARRTGAAVLAGRSHEGEGAPAYWPWAQVVTACARTMDEPALRSHMGNAAADIARAFPVVRERLPDLSEAPAQDSSEARFRLFDGVANFLVNASGARPLVILLDDLHSADSRRSGSSSSWCEGLRTRACSSSVRTATRRWRPGARRATSWRQSPGPGTPCGFTSGVSATTPFGGSWRGSPEKSRPRPRWPASGTRAPGTPSSSS
jgi:hypothetical protein